MNRLQGTLDDLFHVLVDDVHQYELLDIVAVQCSDAIPQSED